jgi:transcriptional regulator with XRE-family HTH domain
MVCVRSRIAKPNERLKDARKKAGLSQVDLSILAGVPEGVIVRLETGRHVGNDDFRESVARALKKPVSQLFREVE